MELLEEVILTLRGMHQPVIGAINGPAIGGGFCLALACDIRIAGSERLLPGGRHQQRPDRERARALVTCCRAPSVRAARSTSC